MPIYEYRCGECGHQLEAFQKMTEAPLTECPNCHKMALNKLISASGFQLKGTGWYATDYRDKAKEKPKTATDTDNKTEVKASDGTPKDTSSNDSGASS